MKVLVKCARFGSTCNSARQLRCNECSQGSVWLHHILDSTLRHDDAEPKHGNNVYHGSIDFKTYTCCRFLTDAISDVSEKSGLSQAFLGLIILPIAGNACEHITAVLVAYKDKMDLAIGVALGSSIQIAIFVLPVLVLIG